MPTFYPEDIDVDIDEFLSACSSWEIQDLIKALKEDGHLKDGEKLIPSYGVSFNEKEHIDACNKLASSYHRLPNEDCAIIKKISDKY